MPYSRFNDNEKLSPFQGGARECRRYGLLWLSRKRTQVIYSWALGHLLSLVQVGFEAEIERCFSLVRSRSDARALDFPFALPYHGAQLQKVDKFHEVASNEVHATAINASLAVIMT